MSTPEDDARRLGLGPTGRGHDSLGPHDHGELRVAVYDQAGKIVINFGTLLKWVALTPDQTLQLANILISKVAELEQTGPRRP